MVESWNLLENFLNSGLISAMVLLVSLASTSICLFFIQAIQTLDSKLKSEISSHRIVRESRQNKKRFPSITCAPKKYISVVFPAYNEEARLPTVLESSLKYLESRAEKQRGFTYEVLVVDDGSRDGTVAVVEDVSQRLGEDRVRVIQLEHNQGKGAAVRKGVLNSLGSLVLFCDADGATPIEELEKLETALLSRILPTQPDPSLTPSSLPEGGPALESPPAAPLPSMELVASLRGAAFGSRAHMQQHAVVKRAWYRNILMYGFHFCVMMVAGGAVRDTQCGFKLFTRSAAADLFASLRLTRWCFDVELVLLCAMLRVPVVEVPVRWFEMKGSKIRVTSILHMLVEMAIIKLAYSLGVWKVNKLY